MPTTTAGLSDRLVALLIDHVVSAGVTMTVLLLLFSARDPTAPVGGVVFSGVPYLVIFLLYKSGWEGYDGTTLGKRIKGLTVEMQSGGPCTPNAAVVRNLLLIVDWLPACFLLGAGLVSRTPTGQRLGDRVADTIVIETM